MDTKTILPGFKSPEVINSPMPKKFKNMDLRTVKRADLQIISPETLAVEGEELPMERASLDNLLKFSTFNNRSFKHVSEYNSLEEAIEITNSALRTHKLKDEPVSVFLDDSGFLDISAKTRDFTPQSFYEQARHFCALYNLKVGKQFYKNGEYLIHASFDTQMNFGLKKEVFSPGLIFAYTPKDVTMSLALDRLVCLNGMMVKTKGTTVNLASIEHLSRANALLSSINSNPDQVYEPVKKYMHLAAKTPASLGDIADFSRHFEKSLGKPETEEIFRLKDAYNLFPNMPENPSKMWLDTAEVPMTSFDLYNIGTRLASHQKEVQSLESFMFLYAYLVQAKPIANVCNQRPIHRDIYANLPLLRGE